jgi:signal transduction histidine kinase
LLKSLKRISPTNSAPKQADRKVLDIPSDGSSQSARLPAPTAPRGPPTIAPRDSHPARGRGLATRMLLLTVIFVLIAQVMIYVPRLSVYRENLLRDRLAAANTAALVFTAMPDGQMPKELARKLLDSVGAKTIALKTLDKRELLAVAEMPGLISDSYDLRDPSLIEGIQGAFRTLLAADGAVLQLIGPAPTKGAFLEITLDETPIKAATWHFSRTFLTISLTLSAVVASSLWAAIWLMILKPVRRLTSNIMAFGERPQEAARIIAPTRRRDEIGGAERALASMQTSLAQELAQKKRLAELGMAVAQINHDLRNMLTAAQLISDRLAKIPDPLAQRLAPRLVATLDRAIAFCQATLTYSGGPENPPLRQRFPLRGIVDQAVEATQAEHGDALAFSIDIPPDFEVLADPDDILRVVENLTRNAAQALSQSGPAEGRASAIRYEARREDSFALLIVSDTGPGLPPGLAEHIFEPFHTSTRRGGSGLGLAIAADLVARNGGSIAVAPTPPGGPAGGARFHIRLASA